jgi:hypothetical protein
MMCQRRTTAHCRPVTHAVHACVSSRLIPVPQVPLFHGLDEEIMAEICFSLLPITVTKNDRIFDVSDVCFCLVFSFWRQNFRRYYAAVPFLTVFGVDVSTYD